MNKFNIIGFFCEDLREEKDEVVTLIGLIPDNVQVLLSEGGQGKGKITATRTLTKLCLYVRINFDPSSDLPEPSVQLAMPDGTVMKLGSIDLATVQKSKSEALRLNLPLAGILLKVVISGFRPAIGLLKAEVLLNGEPHLAGILNFQARAEEATSSTAH